MKYYLLSVLGLLGAIGGSWYWQQRQETQLLTQLAPLTQTVEAVNVRVRKTATEALKRMEETVAKDRNLPRDIAIFASATRLHTQATALLDTLSAQRAALRHSLVTPAAVVQQRTQRQAAKYAKALAQLQLADSVERFSLRWNEVPVAAILADIAHLENQILTSETRAIRQLSRTVGASSFASQLVAVATAESAVVAPGDAYRAQLFLVKRLVPHTLHMYCDGRPVPTSPDGVGLVRFRAPRQPGPASWVGKIRINQNGRDTTFAVRVAYRVARR